MALYASSSIPRMLARSSAGEHYLDTVGVAGSIPVEPTILCPLRSVGSGSSRFMVGCAFFLFKHKQLRP